MKFESRMSVFALLVLPFALFADEKRVIATGWDLGDVPPSEVLAHASEIAELGIDGVALEIFGKMPDGRDVTSRRVSSKCRWDAGTFTDSMQSLSRFSDTDGLRHSFIGVWFQPWERMSWTDDAAWAIFAENLSVVAAVARKCRMEGVLLDSEDYPLSRQFFRQQGELPYDELRILARRRGREVFARFFAENPSMTVFFFYFLTQEREYVFGVNLQEEERRKGDLWPAFINGFLEALPTTARFVDGNEHAYAYRADFGEFYASASRQRNRLIKLIDPSLRSKFRAQISVSSGHYLDSYINSKENCWYLPPLAGSRGERLADNLWQAIDAADEYVWLYGENGWWAGWNPKTISNSRSVGKKRWTDCIPAFAEAIRQAKDPNRAISDLTTRPYRLRPLFEGPVCADSKLPMSYDFWASDDASPLAYGGEKGTRRIFTMGLTNGSACVMATAKGLEPGDLLLVQVRAKGEFVRPPLYYKRDGKWLFQMPTALLDFSAPDVNGWRVGSAALRVPYGAEEISMQLPFPKKAGAIVTYDDIRISRKRCLPAETDRDRLIAHRGDSLQAPENTIPAFKAALDEGYGVEADLYLSTDGVPYCTHDSTRELFKQKCGVAKLPSEFAWKGELEVLDYGSWKGEKWKGVGFARLDDLLAIYPSGRRIVLDIKCAQKPETYRKIREVVDCHSQVKDEDIVFLGEAAFSKKFFPKSPCYYCWIATRTWDPESDAVPREELLKPLGRGFDGLSLLWNPRVTTSEFVRFFNARGYKVSFWTINDPGEAADAFAAGAVTVTSDSPRKILELWTECK